MDTAQEKHGWIANIVHLLDLDTDSLLLSAPSISEEEGSLDEWEIVPDSEDLTGFELLRDSVRLEVGS